MILAKILAGREENKILVITCQNIQTRANLRDHAAAHPDWSPRQEESRSFVMMIILKKGVHMKFEKKEIIMIS